MQMDLAHWRNRQLAWYVVLPTLGLIMLLFGMLLSRNAAELRDLQRQEATLRVQISESQSSEQALRLKLSTAGSTGTMTGEARSMSFVSPNEICFQVMNADQLDSYTQAEWEIIVEEYRLSR